MQVALQVSFWSMMWLGSWIGCERVCARESDLRVVRRLHLVAAFGCLGLGRVRESGPTSDKFKVAGVLFLSLQVAFGGCVALRCGSWLRLVVTLVRVRENDPTCNPLQVALCFGILLLGWWGESVRGVRSVAGWLLRPLQLSRLRLLLRLVCRALWSPCC